MQEDVYQGDGLNLYAYCANNPVIYYDPSGFYRAKKLFENEIANKLCIFLKTAIGNYIKSLEA